MSCYCIEGEIAVFVNGCGVVWSIVLLFTLPGTKLSTFFVGCFFIQEPSLQPLSLCDCHYAEYVPTHNHHLTIVFCQGLT
jgi:hypothetical protein